MKIATLFSPSHEKMLNTFFLPSFPKDDRLELKVHEAEQIAGEHPKFNDSNWKEFMKIKTHVLYEGLQSVPEGEIFGFIDVDIINVNNFHDYVLEAIKDVDFVAQSDSPLPHVINICTGIIFFKNNENCRNLLKAVSTYLDKFSNEQEALTYFAGNHRRFEELRSLKAGLFPFSRAFTYGSLNRNVWHDKSEDFDLPDKSKLMWVHANFAVHEYKEKLLHLFNLKLGNPLQINS